MEVFDIFKADFENKTTLIEASAGTGKTYTITSLVVRLILLKKLTIDQILVVTFTEAAASELKDRILSRLRQTLKGYIKKEEGKFDEIDDLFIKETIKEFDLLSDKELIIKAIRSFDLAPIFTIHGFCYRILSENAFETKNFFNSEIITDENLLIQQSADDFYRKYIDNASLEEAMIIHSNNLYPEKIAELSKKYLKYEDIDIITPEINKDISLLFKKFNIKKEELSDLWFKTRDELHEIFINDESLNKQKYKPSYFDSRALILDDIFNSPNTSPDIFIKEKIDGKKNPFIYFIKSSIENGVKKGKTPPQHIFFDEAESLYENAKDICLEIDKYVSYYKKKAIKETGEQLNEIKERYRLLGFNDFLTRVKKGIDKDTSGVLLNILKNKYKAALIDEFQDTDSLQYEIFKKVFKDKIPLFFIGDPKQAIYRFRGADLFAYLKAKEDADHKKTLNKNYRSSPGAVESVNRIFSLCDNPFIYEKVGYQNITPAKDESESVVDDGKISSSMNIVYLKDEAGKNYTDSEKFINTYICSKISSLLFKGNKGEYLLSDKQISLEDIAVLVRSNNQGRDIRKALEENKIPAVLTSEESIFDSDEAIAVLEFLDSVHNNTNERKIRGVLTGDLFLKKTSELNEIFNDEFYWNRVVEDFKTFNLIWNERGIMEMLNYLYYEKNILNIQSKLNSGERRITNLLHLFEVLHEEEVKTRHGQESLIKWLADNIYNRTSSAQEYELRLESDKNKVRILTVHKSKGLEFPVVFCAFIQREAGAYLSKEKETLYHSEDNNNLVLNLNPAKDDITFSLMEKELLSEDLRLFYVALTRAKYKTWFFMNENKRKNFNKSPDYIFKNQDETDIEKGLKYLELKSAGDIKVEIYDSFLNAKTYDLNFKKDNIDFKRCEFTRKPENNFRILSFSSITHSKSRENEKFDLEAENKPQEINEDPLNLGIHGFPKGAFAGIFFHSIFEDLNFMADDAEIEKLILSKLESFNYDINWLPSVLTMVKNVLNKDLLNGFKLSDIKEENKLVELEFYYPLEENEINSFLKFYLKSDINPNFKDKLQKITPDFAKGYMKGFIDLVFEHNNRFYILDWKSNHLGYSYSDYNKNRLEHEMAKTAYFLQYYIYTNAYDKYLKYRLGNNYSFKENFGGVYYLFLRGIKDGEGDSGVFYDKPLKYHL